MTKEDFLHPLIESVLSEVSFIRRYEHICSKYSKVDESYHWNENELVHALKSKGFDFNYNEEQKFFIEDSLGQWVCKFGFDIRWNAVEFACSIKNDQMKIHSEAPWGYWVKLMVGRNLKKPSFSNELDLIDLLLDASYISKIN